MNFYGLKEAEWRLIKGIFKRHKEITGVILFGSRAKGTAVRSSDVDFALEGNIDPLKAEEIANELDELPLPYRFDIKVISVIRHEPLMEHINRVGVRVFSPAADSPLATQLNI